MKGNKRELIQLGVPIFGQIKDDTKSKKKILNGKSDNLIFVHFNKTVIWFF